MAEATQQHEAFVESLAVDLEARTIRHSLVLDEVGSDGLVVRAGGMDTERFAKNPVVFDEHGMTNRSAVGLCDRLILEGESHLMAITRLNARPPNHEGEWWPDTLLWLHHQKALRGWSVTLDASGVRRPTADESRRYGRSLGGVVDAWPLIEYSAVAIPASPGALTARSALACSDGLLRHIERGRPVDIDTLRRELPRRRTYSVPSREAIAAEVSRAVRGALGDAIAQVRGRIRYQ